MIYKKITLRLFLLLMQCNFVAARAVLLDLHLFGMLALISCTNVVFFTTHRALKSNIVSRHVLIPPDFYRKQYNINLFKIQENKENSRNAVFTAMIRDA